MHIAICDDNEATVRSLYRLVKDYLAMQDLTLTSLSMYTDGTILLKDYISHKQLDILFLDIDMPSISGMELAHQLRLAGSNTILVFITSYPEFMASSFQVETFDFLTKPISIDNFNNTLKRCIKKYQQHHGKISIKTSHGTAVVYLHNILYIKSTAHYIDFVSKDGSKITSLMTLTQLEEKLSLYPQFVRCHQSFIANLDYITEVQKKKIILISDYQWIINHLPVSKRYSNIVNDKFIKYHF